MKILVTGAGGYLGLGVVKALCDMGAEVIATDINTELVDSRAEAVNGDIFVIENPYDYFNKPDALLHMAYRNGFVHNADSHAEDLPLHYKFIRSFSENGCRVCAMGSMHEIGFFEGAIDENTPCAPLSMYGIAKNALRAMLELLSKQTGAPLQWLRGYYIVGDSPRGNSIFAKIAMAASEGKTEFPFTSGVNKYDFLDYEEFCLQVAAAAMQDKVLGTINICSGEPVSLADRVERFIKENGYNIKLLYGVYPDRPYDSKAVWGDNSRIKQIMQEVANGSN